MPLILPLLTDLGVTPRYRFQCELEGATYTFELIYNDRDDVWYIQIGDGQANFLAGSQRVVLGTSLFGRYKNTAGMPPGMFVCVDTSSQSSDAGLADLGSRVQIWYYTAAEVAVFV